MKTTTHYELNDIRNALNLAMADERWEAVAKYASQLADATAAMAAQKREEDFRGLSMFNCAQMAR